MLVKIVTIFLIFMAVLAMFGRLRWPQALRRPRKQVTRRESCPRCGRFIIGKAPCDCANPKNSG